MSMFRCTRCRGYTMRTVCPTCGSPAVSPHPARFSPEDRFVRFRWMLKKERERHGTRDAQDA